MKQKDSLNKRLASLVLLSVLSVPWVASAAGNSVVANNVLPGNGHVVAGSVAGVLNGSGVQGNQMNLHQTTQNAIVTWDSFSIGANASVTIRGDHANFNMLNYVTGSESSQIYGKLNSYVDGKQGGNIYLVNSNGVQIGNSAEINVGSLHIANKKIDNINNWTENTDIANALKQNKAMTNAELMSLGYINASKLVFEGERVVIDMDRLGGLDTTKNDAVTIVSKPYDDKSVGDKSKYDIVLGSSTPEKAAEWGNYMVFTDVSDNGGQMDTAFFTYRWIKDGKELAKIGTASGWGMSDHYALRYSIDLTGSGHTPIGNTKDNAFKGKFDGLDNSIFGLSIDNSDNSKGKATGLFGFTNGAIMGNVTLIAGSDDISVQGGSTDTGAFIGHAVNTTVKGVNSTLKVSGTNNVGGIIGYSSNSELSNLTNTGNISGVSNVGGLVGYMDGGKLADDEENRVQYTGSYNLGKITGIDKVPNYSSNIGGLIGKAENATIGGTKNTLINYNTVEGGYNVGGIVGSAVKTTVSNASNEGVVKANGYTIDSYIYHTDNNGWKNNNTVLTGTHKAEVRAANVGGIVGSSAGSELKDVTNKADVSSALVKKTTDNKDPSGFDHYAAGNVGGIVGRAEDSNITNANNVESNIRSAMNVGGIAGYFGSTDVNNQNKKNYRILNAINNGGDIMATGGIKKDGSFTKEKTHKEEYITGNIGGIAGYLYGAPVHIEASGNRGDVHTAADTSKLTSQAVNVGGIVGKFDLPKITDSAGKELTDNDRLAIIKGDNASAVVSSSYNTGNVTGYTNIGGIGGFAYNGSIAASYNVGDIKTTRHDAAGYGVTPINMGGILGESTELAVGRVIIYDTYNKGTIGDSSYNTYGRHVGGIVGRLSGIVEKSYNNGDIYNGFNVVGGIVGYWYNGYLKNVFNTGNITVYNKNSATSQVGGIVGSVDLSGGNLTSGTNAALSISNAYNLGSLRSFKGLGNNEVGGIVGATYNYSGTSNRLKISNAYTMGNMYVNGGGFIGDIVGVYERGTIGKNPVDYANVYYIRPQADNGYIDLTSETSKLKRLTNAKAIDYDKLSDKNQWGDFSFSKQKDGKIEGATDDNWRMSDGSLPILNAFLSGSHKYFSQDSNWQEFMKDNYGANVQYGTAYDPLLTIINTKKDLSFNWSDMDLKNNGSLAVFGLYNAEKNLNYTPGLTLNNVEITNSTHIFGGTIYSDGLLELNAKDDLQDGLRFGMSSKLYGSDVVLNTNSSMELSGSVISTGNHNELSSFNPEKSHQHGININASDLTVYGQLITLGKEGEDTEVIVPGINYGYLDSQTPDKDKVANKDEAMTSQGMEHAYRLHTTTAKTGNITISTMENTLDDGTYMSGAANLLYGNYKKGKIVTKGNLNVSSSGDILVDSDLDVAGSINLEGAEVPDGSGYVYVNNITLDLSNIGGELKGNERAKALHAFIDAHKTEATGIYGNNNSDTDDKRSMKITLDYWDDDYIVGGVKGNLKYTKYDLKKDDNTTVKLTDKLKSLYVEKAGENYSGNKIHNVIYAWISNAEELNSVQRVAEQGTDGNVLGYNYALKNDIDASGLVDTAGKSTYNTIGSGDTAFTGTFDGNGHTIVGLQAKGGIFGKLGKGAVVKNINIASSVFTGKAAGDSVGAVAAENNGGEISGISGYGNTVKGSGGYIGGLVGKNYGSITDSDDQSTIIAGANTVAGGIAGVNGSTVDANTIGYIDNVQSNSAVTTGDLSASQYASNLGGIVGKNAELFTYNINNVSAHGVTGKTGTTKTSGGIVGTNEGSISNAYNESIIHGSENIGGIAGSNAGSKATLGNIANAVEIIGDAGSENVGGLVGMQDQATTNMGRNTGAITGCTNVGGMVGYNTAGSDLNNLENSPQATITGITNVGGIAGVNEGVISADDQLNLINSGKIYGWENVGGIAGKNSGTIANVNSNINLNVIDEETRNALKGSTDIAANAQFFGGVTGENVGIITNATNRAKVDAEQASYVGGIVGRNTSEGEGENKKVGQLLGIGNAGFVIGKNYVGGVIGKNEMDITGTATQSVGIVNSGTVIASAGGAGGIIGENSAKITYVNMKNEGEVHGNDSAYGSTEENGTGGIIGVNGSTAKITNSSLMNSVNGNVSGVANVGGIIGINHGVITGGRDANNNYYKYQIYNNGTIQAGSYDAASGTITAVAGENIGGLLGNNSGTLIAGYNTGVVKAEQSSNVGGIASGTLDQVFNSVVTVTKTETGETDAAGRKLYNYTYTDDGAISGYSNVGGIVGSNTGTLSNAYSTTAVAGNSNVANIVGSNAGNVSNVYGYAANGNTNVNNGTVTNSYIINADGKLQENGNDAKKLDSYGFENKATIWKLYDKHTNPLLKVFLTKVTVAPDLQQGWVYDATNHLDIPGWIQNGKLTTNDAAHDAFAAYKNNNSLVQGEALKNAGTYSSWLWSGQIASGGDAGPNNLGYDFTVSDIKVSKKVLNVTGNTVNRTYGNLHKDHDYALSIEGFGSFNDAMKTELDGKVKITDSQDDIQNSKDGGIITAGSEKRTNNKGEYSWQAGVKLDDSIAGNYEFQNGGVGIAETTVTGVSNVLARKVYLNNITANLTYGSSDAINNHINGVVSIKDLASAIVYGDNVKLADGAVVNVKDGSVYATNKGERNTADAGTYDNSLKIDNAVLTGDANKLGNYELVNDATGSIKVEQATMHVTLNDVKRTYGNTALINGTAYGVNSLVGNVNGDNYGVGAVTMGAVTNDGALTGASTGKVTNDAGNHKWNANVVTANDKLKQNYKLVVDDGNSVVGKANLVVNLNDITRVYGNLEAKDYKNAFTFGNNAGLVNGDSGLVIDADKDGAITEGSVSDVKKTNNVGSYEWNGTASGVDNLNTNYNVQINAGKSDVTKAKLVVNLNDITRVYGNFDAKNYSNAYTFGADAGLVNGDKGLVINANADGAIAGGTLTNVEKTNNVGSYTWNGTASGVDKLDTNYNVTVNAGKSDVTKANLVVNLNDITRVYGNLDAKDYSKAYTFGENAGLVNGDNGLVINANKDGAIAGGTLTNVEKTNNVGSYEWTGTASGVDNLNTNYDVQINAGKSDVTKANLVVNLNDITRVYGNQEAKDYKNAFTYGADAGLVNGDSGLVINANADGAIVGGTLTNVEKTNNVGSYEWKGTASGVDNLNTNYDVTVNAGKSDVTKANLVVNLSDITRVYGNLDAKDYKNAYKFGANAGLVNGDSGLVIKANTDGAIAEGSVSDVKKTSNVGSYTWNGTASGVDNLNTNYDVQINAGKSEVTKANLVVNLKDITRVYGNLDAKDYSKAYTFGENAGLVNGDNGLVINANKDGAIAGGTLTNVEKTNNVGSYTWNGTASGVDNLNTNYDVQINAGKSAVTKANLVVNLNDITRVYGNLDAKNYRNAYTFGADAGLVNGDNGLVINANADGAIAEGSVSDVKKTSNVGSYTWNGTASGVDNLNTNYDVQINAGKSAVTKAKLVVNLKDITRVYGNLDAKDYKNAYTFGADAGLVNGDKGLVINANADGAIAEGSVSDVKKTSNVGSYTWNGTASGVDNLNTNYDVQINAGKSAVTKAKLSFAVDDKTITQGVPAEYTGTANGLTNGDTLAGIGVGGYELDSSVNPLIVGVYEDKIGVLINGSVYLTGGDLLKNYKVEIESGTLTVLASFNPADDYWFGTAPWDKERNLRERKAEFHYVAGGMSL